MTSIDDLFKKPNLPSKRKLEVSHDPSEYYKTAKTSANGDAKGRSHDATVEDEPEEDDDIEAGPELPPDDEDDNYGPDDDEEGRFFGGGMDQRTKEAMDFLDERDKDQSFVEEKYDVSWVRKLGLAFEKKISKNSELRAKFEDDPTKFMASEADLDEGIKELSILSEHAELYPEFVKLGCVASLVSLLAHENADVAIDAVEILNELVDEDVEATEEQWNLLVDAALEADLLSLLVQNFSRLDEGQESDRAGVYNSLSILESLASQNRVSEVIAGDKDILKWLLSRIQKEEKGVGQNKQYAAELLSILVQSSNPNRAALIKLDAVDIFLQLLAPFRRRDPEKDSEEEEYFENLFDALTCLVDIPEGKTKFIEAEGVELMLIMLREGKLSKARSLRLLDHAAASMRGGEVCSKMVEAQGLKTIFGLFMKKPDSTAVEHLLGIFSAFLKTLPADSAERIRTLAKFVEKDYEKIGKLVTLRRDYAQRLSAVEQQIDVERKAAPKNELDELEVDWFSRRLEAGLYGLQTLDVVLAWLSVEDAGALERIRQLLKERDQGLSDVRATLQGQLDGITDDDEEAQGVRDMLGTLLDLLR